MCLSLIQIELLRPIYSWRPSHVQSNAFLILFAGSNQLPSWRSEKQDRLDHCYSFQLPFLVLRTLAFVSLCVHTMPIPVFTVPSQMLLGVYQSGLWFCWNNVQLCFVNYNGTWSSLTSISYWQPFLDYNSPSSVLSSFGRFVQGPV